MMVDEQRKQYCRDFLRHWCWAGPDSGFRVVSGYRRPRRIVEKGREVVVVGALWLDANAVPVAYLSEEGGSG